MRNALIYADTPPRLCQVADETFPVAAPFMWIECPPDVTPETHDYVGGDFVQRPPVTVVQPPGGEA
jgi:hypothetical protein